MNEATELDRIRAMLLRDDALARAKFLSLIPVIDSESADHRIRAWRKEGRIFAVEHGGVDLYPAFQFGNDGQPLPIVAALLNRATSRSHAHRLAERLLVRWTELVVARSSPQ